MYIPTLGCCVHSCHYRHRRSRVPRDDDHRGGEEPRGAAGGHRGDDVAGQPVPALPQGGGAHAHLGPGHLCQGGDARGDSQDAGARLKEGGVHRQGGVQGPEAQLARVRHRPEEVKGSSSDSKEAAAAPPPNCPTSIYSFSVAIIPNNRFGERCRLVRQKDADAAYKSINNLLASHAADDSTGVTWPVMEELQDLYSLYLLRDGPEKETLQKLLEITDEAAAELESVVNAGNFRVEKEVTEDEALF
eukprot:8634023-Pyramimonas_sp.AAC.1